MEPWSRKPPLDFDGLLAAARVATQGSSRPKLSSKNCGRPIGFERGLLLQPAAEVGADGLDFGAPDLRDGGGQVGLGTAGDLLQDGVQAIERGRQALRRDGQGTGGGERAEELELDGVVDGSAGGRVEALDGGGTIGGAQAVNAAQREAVGAARVLLQHRGRPGARREQLGRQGLAADFLDEEAVGGLPRFVPAHPAGAQGIDRAARQALQILAGAPGERRERGEIEFGIVDGVRRGRAAPASRCACGWTGARDLRTRARRDRGRRRRGGPRMHRTMARARGR